MMGLIFAFTLFGYLSNASGKANFSSNVIACDSNLAQTIEVGSSQIVILDFILPPREVIPSKNVFTIKAIKSDIIIRPRNANAKSLFVVYIDSKRCLLNLVTTKTKTKDVYLIRDPKDSVQEVGAHGN